MASKKLQIRREGNPSEIVERAEPEITRFRDEMDSLFDHFSRILLESSRSAAAKQRSCQGLTL